MAIEVFDLLIIVLLVIGVYSAIPHVKKLLGADAKACPYCAERIRKQAIVCRYCHRSLDSYYPD